jgi:hypothetical protein
MNRVITLLSRHWLIIIGFIVVLFYLTTAFQIIDFPDIVFIILFLSISPVAILGVYTVGKRLAKSHPEPGEVQFLCSYKRVSGKTYGQLWPEKDFTDVRPAISLQDLSKLLILTRYIMRNGEM